jgi:hypothetical protein
MEEQVLVAYQQEVMRSRSRSRGILRIKKSWPWSIEYRIRRKTRTTRGRRRRRRRRTWSRRRKAGMAVRFTVSRCPVDLDVQESSGVPWGATVVPFAAVDEHGRAPEHGGSAQLLPRCDTCWAYINYVCDVDKWAWTCALCGNLNGFSDDTSARYRSSQAPELLSSFIDFEMDEELPNPEDEDFEARPVFVAAVDLSGVWPFFSVLGFDHV